MYLFFATRQKIEFVQFDEQLNPFEKMASVFLYIIQNRVYYSNNNPANTAIYIQMSGEVPAWSSIYPLVN